MQMKKVLKPIETKESDSLSFGSDALLQSASGVGMRSYDGTLNTRTGAVGKEKALGLPPVEETCRSKKVLKANRLRGRIENAKQIDQIQKLGSSSDKISMFEKMKSKYKTFCIV